MHRAEIIAWAEHRSCVTRATSSPTSFRFGRGLSPILPVVGAGIAAALVQVEAVAWPWGGLSFGRWVRNDLFDGTSNRSGSSFLSLTSTAMPPYQHRAPPN